MRQAALRQSTFPAWEGPLSFPRPQTMLRSPLFASRSRFGTLLRSSQSNHIVHTLFGGLGRRRHQAAQLRALTLCTLSEEGAKRR